MKNAMQAAMRIDRVAGVDGVRGGWVMAVTGADRGEPVEFSTWSSFAELWTEACAQDVAVVAVDIPIGLPGLDRRTADVGARAMLGPRWASLFWTPMLGVLEADSHAEANRLSRAHTGSGVSTQFFGLVPKIREVRASLPLESFQPPARPRVAEVHPEVGFAVLAGGPMSFPKKNKNDSNDRRGVEQRLAALEEDFRDIALALQAPLAGRPKAALDDLLDSTVAAWTARRIVSGEAVCLGEGEFDATGYPMHIWV